MCIGAIAGIGSALIGSKSAGDAADAQAAAAAQQAAIQKQIYDDTTERFEPFYGSGLNYQRALDYEMGIGERPTFGGNPLQITEFTDPVQTTPVPYTGSPEDRPYSGLGAIPGATQQTGGGTRFRVGDQVFNTREAAQEYANANPTGGREYQGYEATPWYDFQLDQGIRAIDQSAASSGNLFSGNTMKRAQGYGQNLASGEYQNYLNRVTAGAQGGQAAAGNQAAAGANYAAGASNALANMGNAQAAGAIGQGNAIMGGINTGIGLWNYQNQMAPQQSSASQFPGMQSTINNVNSLFGF